MEQNMTKEKIEKVTRFIESCWDENQKRDDGLSFNERVHERMKSLPDDEKKIVEAAINW